MSGESIFNDVDSIYINNKEVQSIKRVDDGAIIYEKIMILGEPLEFIFEGTTLTQDSNGLFSGTNMIIDYGDGTIEPTTGNFGHTYSENGTYQVKIYGVTNLNQNCFRYCTGLTSIEIPNSVSSIGDYCFYGCTGLTSIEIPNSVSSLGHRCFMSCTNLISIVISDNVSSLGNYCFWKCTGLTSIIIPDSVTSLGDYCFYGCTSLNNYYLNWTSSSKIIAYNSGKMPNNTNTIFHIPKGTKQLYIDKGYPSDKLKEPSVMTLTVTGSSFSTYSAPPFTYNDEVFVDWGDDTGLVEYTGGKLSHSFTDGLNSHTVKVYGDLITLGRACFKNCTGLTSITIPDGVISLEMDCFYGCTGLTSIILPNSVTNLKETCFYGCTNLTSITLPSNISSLENGCFWNCTNLTSINIPNSVTNIGNYCFNQCTGLTLIILNWTSNDILTYNANWIANTSKSLKFQIPYGTIENYVEKNFSISKLQEIEPPIV